DPEDIWIARRDGDVADRRGPLVIEDRLPRRAAVGRLPHSARSRRSVEQLTQSPTDLRRGTFGYREIDDAPARYGRSDRSPRKLRQPRGVRVEDRRRRL